ncbi:outer membrane protein assembly factor BamA (plasmid) [Pseudorhodobacter turbinis]|uniref:Outer membrane protein assembly factor BamA n=2 Tax=Pseudorhodobacter turbinis TaxID=2500533 RepID=A0A4P8EIX7_9RHOB|nr:outer membrane protein assembly factor BamA [Pseudorhodobacter turbinis]QCO56908.1 outer membrane protein assembly factor BamA [Pseudorhodobacter turbinis]
MHIADRGLLSRNILRKVGRQSAAASVYAFVAMAGLTAPQQAFAQSYQFSSVKVEGNDRVDAATILSYARIGRGQTISAGELNDAFQRISDVGLFEDVQIIPQGGTLLIKVQELPTVNVINFEGNKRLKDEMLASIVKSQSRRVFSAAQAEADAAEIAKAYQESGRIAASVDPRIIRRSGNRVDLVFDIKEGKVVEVERVSFVGNRAYSDRRLRQVLETKQAGIFRRLVQSDTFVADRIEFDKQMLKDFYAARGYVDFQVQGAVGEVTRERDGFFVTFTVREGQSFKLGRVTTVSEIPEVDAAEFQKALKLRSGITYSPTVIETNITRLENLALRKSLNFVRIEPRITRNDRDLTLDVEFVISKGPRIFVERIDIEGNTTTLDEVIRREFRAAEGDPFNPREVRRAAERIRALGFFKDARVNSEQGSAADQVIVNVDVEEQPTGSLSFGVSYGADSGVGLTAGFRESNFLGRGQTVGASLSTGTDNKSGSINFMEPAFLGRDLSFSFDIGYAETENQNSDYDTRVANIGLGVGFPVGEYSRLQLNYKVVDSRIKNVDDDSSQILHNEASVGGQLTSSVGYGFSYDTRSSGLNPDSGLLLRFNQDFAGLGGDLTYVSTTGLAMAERRIWNDDITLRAVVEGGMINMSKGDSRVTERFFLNSKIRGFEGNGVGPRDLNAVNEDALGGNVFAAARFEAEFPIGLPEEYNIKGGAFFDVGSVWSLDQVTGGPKSGVCPVVDCTVDDSMNLRSSVGVSLFWETPVGPLRFNLSKAVKKEDYDKERNFDLTISSQF